MAGAGGIISMSLRLSGVEQAVRRLNDVGAKVEPVMRGALNTTATQGRTQRYVRPMSRTIKPQRLRAALKVKRANSRRLNARIIPSSSGVLVVNYRNWGFDVLSPTRARIWVTGPNGRKVAAGFVNPSSAHKLPLSTRSVRAKGAKTYNYQRALQLAQGPSVAYWFKQLSGGQTIRWINAFLQQEFEKRIRREIARRG